MASNRGCKAKWFLQDSHQLLIPSICCRLMINTVSNECIHLPAFTVSSAYSQTRKINAWQRWELLFVAHWSIGNVKDHTAQEAFLRLCLSDLILSDLFRFYPWVWLFWPDLTVKWEQMCVSVCKNVIFISRFCLKEPGLCAVIISIQYLWQSLRS